MIAQLFLFVFLYYAIGGLIASLLVVINLHFNEEMGDDEFMDIITHWPATLMAIIVLSCFKLSTLVIERFKS